MSAYRLWTLTCDWCGEIFDADTSGSLADARQDARQCGWRTGKTQRDNDYCTNCVRAGEEG